MKFATVRSLLSIAALAAVAACGGGATGGAPGMVPAHGGNASKPPPQTGILSKIVGVGDSLTAGYQSDGFLGETGIRNKYNPGHPIPPNQVNGFWSYLDEQASGKSIDSAVNDIYNPNVSPLPLIKGPGLDNQIVPCGSPCFGFPFSQLKTGNVCTDNNGFNLAGYRLRGAPRVRMNPTSKAIRNLGVPGLTLHEANVLHAPQSSTCQELPGIPGLLNLVIAEESGTFWPVLLNFTNLKGNLTEANAAASLHPTLATVWLGANDVLKYMGSGGRFVGGDRNATQAESDLRATISTLEHVGARVVVANLPNILQTGFFQRVTVPNPKSNCKLRTYAWCTLYLAGMQPFTEQIAKKYGLDTPNGCVPGSLDSPCGYLTLPGVALIIQYYGANEGTLPDLDCVVPAPHCKPIKGNGQGTYYITPPFAAKVQSLNNAINQGIDNAAKASNVPLVDVAKIFHGLASGDPSNPYFKLAASINPGKCCYLGYLYGITSFDGLHPSNTGYALIASEFIATINAAYGTKIPQVDITAAYNGTRCSNKDYCFRDPYAPPYDGL